MSEPKFDPNHDGLLVGYEGLCMAIISAAAHDYRVLFKRKLYGFPFTKKNQNEFDATERFFKSEYYRGLTDVDGEYIMNRIADEERKIKVNMTDKERQKMKQKVEKAWERKRKEDAERAEKKRKKELEKAARKRQRELEKATKPNEQKKSA